MKNFLLWCIMRNFQKNVNTVRYHVPLFLDKLSILPSHSFLSKISRPSPLPLLPFLLTLKSRTLFPTTSPPPPFMKVRTMHKRLIHKLICCQSLVIKYLYDKNIICAKVDRGNQVARKLFSEPCFCLVRVWFCLWI